MLYGLIRYEGPVFPAVFWHLLIILLILSMYTIILYPCILFFFLIYLFIYFYFWLRWVFVAARGLFSSCGEWGLLFVVVRGLLIAVASLVAEHGL